MSMGLPIFNPFLTCFGGTIVQNYNSKNHLTITIMDECELMHGRFRSHYAPLLSV